MSRVDGEFAQRVYSLVERIPEGRVMTYGQVAAICGAAWAAWEVGQIAHRGPADLPWHRVVNKKGGLAAGWPNGGRSAHAALLVSEGVEVSDNFQINVDELLWIPE
jgi:methylated-DNA-protein-cysteine methyltransferase related protein